MLLSVCMFLKSFFSLSIQCFSSNVFERLLPGSLKGVSRVLQRCYKEVSGKFQGSFRVVLKVVSRMLGKYGNIEISSHGNIWI